MTFYVCPKCGHLTHERADCPKCATTGELAYAFTDLDDAIEFRQSIRDATAQAASGRMSEPVYLIEVTHDPHSETLPWDARVKRISDDSWAVTRWGSTREEAVRAAQAWIRAEAGVREQGATLYANEDGELLIGESVRVLRPTS